MSQQFNCLNNKEKAFCSQKYEKEYYTYLKKEKNLQANKTSTFLLLREISQSNIVDKSFVDGILRIKLYGQRFVDKSLQSFKNFKTYKYI